MKTQIKAKEMIAKIYPLLAGALSGKLQANKDTLIEISGNKFAFEFRKDKDYITIVFTGNKPKITATRGIWIFSADFEGDIAEISFNQTGGFVKLDGLPQQTFEFT